MLRACAEPGTWSSPSSRPARRRASPGPWCAGGSQGRVTVAAAGFAGAVVPFSPVRHTRVDVVLEDEVALAGRVAGGGGATVVAESRSFYLPDVVTTADADGRFRLRGLGPRG